MEKLNKTSNFDDACGFFVSLQQKYYNQMMPNEGKVTSRKTSALAKVESWSRALVTGEGTGLGKMISKLFIKNGAKFYISSKILEEGKIWFVEVLKLEII